MKVAIMQPYLFPYIGYFQLINAVDIFVVYDDVNYIKKGWINRNAILVNNSRFQFTFPILKVSQNAKINELKLDLDSKNSFLKTIVSAYAKAPFFNVVYPLIEEIFQYKQRQLSDYLVHSLQKICGYLNINTQFVISSEQNISKELKASERIIAICKSLKAETYYNAIGGQELYDATDFQKAQLQLHFLQTNPMHYKQFDAPFISWLSIIDVMMFNDVDEIKKMLNNYTLL